MVHTSVAELREPWLKLQAEGVGTIYQTYEWCLAWQEAVGDPAGIESRVVLGIDESAAPVFILPLAIAHSYGCRILQWHGYPHIGYGWGLYDRGFLAARHGSLAQLWEEIVEAAGPVDGVRLADSPAQWRQVPHPLRELFTVRSANTSYAMHLDRDFGALYRRKRSGETRRSSRKRDQRLSTLGKVWFGLPQGNAAVHQLLDLALVQQEERLANLGIREPVGAGGRDLLHRLADISNDAGPLLLPFHLTLEGRLLATMLGGRYDRTFWALVSSLSSGPECKHSPGDLALRRMIEECCAMDLEWIDFAPGDTDYKPRWADVTIDLYEIIRAVTWRGLAWALATLVLAKGKALVKRSPLLWRAARWVRAIAGPYYARRATFRSKDSGDAAGKSASRTY